MEVKYVQTLEMSLQFTPEKNVLALHINWKSRGDSLLD